MLLETRPHRKNVEARIYISWWAWALMYAVYPFAMLAALFDEDAAHEGLVSTLCLGGRVEMWSNGRRIK